MKTSILIISMQPKLFTSYWTNDLLYIPDDLDYRKLLVAKTCELCDRCDNRLDRLTPMDRKFRTCKKYCNLEGRQGFNGRNAFSQPIDSSLLFYRALLSQDHLNVEPCHIKEDLDQWALQMKELYESKAPEVLKLLDSIDLASRAVRRKFMEDTKGLAAISDEANFIFMRHQRLQNDMKDIDTKTHSLNAQLQELRESISEDNGEYMLPEDFDPKKVRNLEVTAKDLTQEVADFEQEFAKIHQTAMRRDLELIQDTPVRELVLSSLLKKVELFLDDEGLAARERESQATELSEWWFRNVEAGQATAGDQLAARDGGESRDLHSEASEHDAVGTAHGSHAKPES